MADLTIIIVNYNSGKFLEKCLESVEKVSGEANIEILVVDNASTDSSVKSIQEKFRAEYILNKQNVGFGKANNDALKKVKTEYILFLNPDTELEKGVLKTMIDFMDEYPGVGAASCKLLLPDGSLDWAAHRGFPTPLASLLYFLGNDSLYHFSSRDFRVSHEVDAISGSFFLTRKSVIGKIGYFDEDYFMYAEDIDLCFRIKKAGYKIMYVPTVEITHYKGISSGLKKHSQTITTATLETKKRTLDAFYQTMKIFYKKHYEKKYPFFINWLVYLGINIKWRFAKRRMVV